MNKKKMPILPLRPLQPDQQNGIMKVTRDPPIGEHMAPAYSLCADGKNQSPINIVKTESGHVDFSLDYKSTSLRIAHHEFINEILNNGHTIQVTVDSGSHLTLNNKQFNLKQFHFHTPSEHTIDGKHAPLEMHMVHQNEDGSLAVIGIRRLQATSFAPAGRAPERAYVGACITWQRA